MIEFSAVSKIYPSVDGPVTALDRVTFTAEPGEFIAVRGASGSGKSTLLSLAGGLDRPTSGHVVAGGQRLDALSASTRAHFRARNIGFVFQMFHLLPYLTVRDNVLVAANSDGTVEASRRVDELLEEFQLSHRINHRPAQLSTGERQRVAMARALVNRPQLLLADEPTGNLDSENAARVLEYISAFNSAGGTVLLVTHEEVAAGYANRTLSLSEGRVGDGVAGGQSA